MSLLSAHAIVFIDDKIWDKLIHACKARGDCMLFYINKFENTFIALVVEDTRNFSAVSLSGRCKSS